MIHGIMQGSRFLLHLCPFPSSSPVLCIQPTEDKEKGSRLEMEISGPRLKLAHAALGLILTLVTKSHDHTRISRGIKIWPSQVLSLAVYKTSSQNARAKT